MIMKYVNRALIVLGYVLGVLVTLGLGLLAIWTPGDLGRNMGNTAMILIVPVIAWAFFLFFLWEENTKHFYNKRDDINKQIIGSRDNAIARLEQELREAKAQIPQDRPVRRKPVF